MSEEDQRVYPATARAMFLTSRPDPAGEPEFSFLPVDVAALKAAYRIPHGMNPDGPGYMPFFCAVHWIATDRGTIKINQVTDQKWEESTKALCKRISDASVKIVGVDRTGTGAALDCKIFAALRFSAPFENDDERLFKAIVSNDTWIFLTPYSPFGNSFKDCIVFGS